jgi:hypothetical protein
MSAKPAKRKNQPNREPNGKFARRTYTSISKVPDPVISDDPDDYTNDIAVISSVLKEPHVDSPVHISAEEIAVIHTAKPPPMNRKVIKSVPSGPLLPDRQNGYGRREYTHPKSTPKSCEKMTPATPVIEKHIVDMIRGSSRQCLQIQQIRDLYDCLFGEKIYCGHLNVTRWLMQFRSLFVDGDKVYVAVHEHRIAQSYHVVVSNPHFKTRMCRSIATGQSCSYGHRCEFAHSEYELRTYHKPQLHHGAAS